MVGRFQVMATLQAARARVLGYPTDVAKSFGLNRAIFYAAAKKGFKGGMSTHPGQQKSYKISPFERKKETVKEDAIGNEKAYFIDVDGKKRFVMGKDILDDKKYNHQVEAYFSGQYNKAWEEALHYVESFDRDVLENQRKFYEEVYKPKREEFAKEWSLLAK